MTDLFVSKGEMVYMARDGEYEADSSLPTSELIKLLSGSIDCTKMPTPIYTASRELEDFVTKYRSLLNLACDGICTQCVELMISMCHLELPQARKEIYEKYPVTSAESPDQSGTPPDPDE